MLCFKVERNGEAACLVGIENPRFIQVSVLFTTKLGEGPTLHAFAQSDETPEFRVTKNWFDNNGQLQIGDSVRIEVVESQTADEGHTTHRQGRRKSGKKIELYCNWCGKSSDDVERIISGPNVYICNECVQLCNDILGDESEIG